MVKGKTVNCKKYKALLVDDDLVTRMITKAYLSNNGFKVRSANNGLRAVELIEDGNSFDLIVIDLHMPVMNGIQATREIRDLGVVSLMVGISADDNEAKIREFLDAGLDDFYAKPEHLAMSSAIVRRLEERACELASNNN